MTRMRYVDAIRAGLELSMEADERVTILGEDVTVGGPFTATRGLVDRFGEKRVRDTPISEPTIVGMATGAALMGQRPVVEVMFIDFITLAMDQFVNHSAKLRYMSGGQLQVPMVIRAQGGASGSYAAHHSQSLEAWFTHVPGLKVVAPSTPADARSLLMAAIADDDPVLYLEHRALYFKANEMPDELPARPTIGGAEVRRPGSDVTIVSWSRTVTAALDAAGLLAEEGVSAEVIDLRSLRPLDLPTVVESITRTGRLVIAHEAVTEGGFGAEVASQVMVAAFDYLDAPIERVGAPFVPPPFSPSLEAAFIVDAADIAAGARRTLDRRGAGDMSLAKLPADELRAQLRTMLRIRRFEEALIKLAQENDIGHYHVYVGQEATGVPALALMEDGDVAYTTHRNHGHLIARGVDPGAMAAEILGKASGTNKGKGGTLHLASIAHGFPTTSSSVGGPMPISVGSAFAFKELGLDRVSISIFGDGALEEGAWHESINIAAMRQVPVIFLCENNSLEALGQKANEYPSSTLAATELSDLVAPFKVPTLAVDGTDTQAVHEAMSEAVIRARSGGGPTFIEARTVRWPGNRPLWPQLLTGETRLEYAWDPASISGEHAKWWREQDGLLIFLRELLGADVLSQQDASTIDEEARAEMDGAIKFAVDSPYPPPSEALDDVYA